MEEKYKQARDVLLAEIYHYPHLKIENMYAFYCAAFEMHKYLVLDSLASNVARYTGVVPFYINSQDYYHHLKTFVPGGDLLLLDYVRKQ